MSNKQEQNHYTRHIGLVVVIFQLKTFPGNVNVRAYQRLYKGYEF